MATLTLLAAVLSAGEKTQPTGEALSAGGREVTHEVMGRADFESFHAETSRPLWSYLSRLTGDPSLAEDVAQDSYLRFLSRPCRHQDAKARRAYLFRIATNLVRDRWRRRRFEAPWSDQLGAGLRVPGEASKIDRGIDFEAVFRTLKPRQRALLWLAYVEGYSHREIGEILSLRSLGVRVLLARARKKLNDVLRAEGLDEPMPHAAQEEDDAEQAS